MFWKISAIKNSQEIIMLKSFYRILYVLLDFPAISLHSCIAKFLFLTATSRLNLPNLCTQKTNFYHFAFLSLRETYWQFCHFLKTRTFRSSHQVVFLGKGVLKTCNKFIEITLRHGYFPVNLLHIFRTPFLRNTSERLLLDFSELY